MKMKQISICVGVVLGCWVSGGAAKAEVFAKGSPVQILTKDKAVAGKLETDSNADAVKVTTLNQQAVTLSQTEIKEIRLLKNSGAKTLQAKVEEARTRGTGNFTEQLSSAFESFFTDKDVRKSDGTRTCLGQVVLDRIHATATLVRLSVHDVQLTYRGEKPPKDFKEVQKIDLRMTLHWKGLGIITDDGWTKVAISYDSEVGQWTKLEVIDTNGVKTNDVLETAGKVALTLFIGWLSSGSN